MLINIPKQYENIIANNKETIIPPAKPSIVFLGLILINFVFPTAVPIKYEKISKVIIIIIKS